MTSSMTSTIKNILFGKKGKYLRAKSLAKIIPSVHSVLLVIGGEIELLAELNSRVI